MYKCVYLWALRILLGATFVIPSYITTSGCSANLPHFHNKDNNCYFASWIQTLNAIPELKIRLTQYAQAFSDSTIFTQLPIAQRLKSSFLRSPNPTAPSAVNDLAETLALYYQSPLKELMSGYLTLFLEIEKKAGQQTIQKTFDTLFNLYTLALGSKGDVGFTFSPPNLIVHPLLADLFRINITIGIADLFIVSRAESSLTETFALSRNADKEEYPLVPSLTQLMLPLPPYLIFRFETLWGKEYTLPLSFDLALYLPEKTPHFNKYKNELVYELISVTAGGTGHAVAYIKTEETHSWCLCDTLASTPTKVSSTEATVWHNPKINRRPLYVVYRKKELPPSVAPEQLERLTQALKELLHST